ncbi:MAG: 2-oxoglutarate dehydrogenase E2 component (dihydrolipoamide succinyltransferase), partial [Phenylobacterium sp.]
MTTQIKVPVLPESVADATIATWHVKVGDSVTRDQILVDIETDKVVLEVPATSDGVVTDIVEEEGATVLGDQLIANISASGAAASAPAATSSEASAAPAAAGGKQITIKVPVLPESVADATIATWHVSKGQAVARGDNLVDIETDKVVLEVVAEESGVMSDITAPEGETVLGQQDIATLTVGVGISAAPQAAAQEDGDGNDALSPSVRRLLGEKGLNADDIKGTGKGG